MIVACATVVLAAPFAGVAALDVDARLTMLPAAMTAAPPPTAAPVTARADRTGGEREGSTALSPLELGVGVAALVVSVAALVVALRRIAPP